jgi:hypothetical protein
MAHVKADKVEETTTTTGTGALTLGGATTGNRTFASVLSNGDTCHVLIQLGSQWEKSLGTYASGANTITRSTILASSTGGLVNFAAGSKTISISPPSARMLVEDPNGDVSLTRDFAIGRNATVAGTLGVTGAATLASTLRVNGAGVGVGVTPTQPFQALVADGTEVLRLIGTARSLRATINATESVLESKSSSSASWQDFQISAKNLIFSTGASGTNPVALTQRWQMWTTTGHFEPLVDNVSNLGSATMRVKEVFAGTGTINTSDAREKQDVSQMADSAAHRAFFLAVARDVRLFRFIDAVRAKGERARFHVGWLAQEIMKLGEEHGVDALAHGFVGFDALVENRPAVDADGKPVLVKTGERETGVLDARGDALMADVMEQPYERVPTGEVRWSIRPDEILAGCICALAMEV